MAENDNGQERTEEATGKRKQEARDKGQIARSRELNTLLMLLLSGAGMFFLGDDLVRDLMQVLRDNLVIERADIFDVTAMTSKFLTSLRDALNAVVPLFFLLVMVAILAPMALGGWSFSFHPMKPELKKIDPIKGMTRVFSLKGLMELAKALAKFLLVGSVGFWLLQVKIPGFMGLGNETLEQGIARMGDELLWAFLLLSSALIAVVAVDVPFQLWDHARKQKMTRQEVKDEHKETEGSPEMKGKVRQTQREIAQRRMMQEVPKADVVITNPTHYAVALRYDQERMGAPIVVALGADEIAGHIRRIATANDVPILSAPPLARALYYNSELDAEIPAGLYLAVAQVLAYVYQLRHYELNGGLAPEFNADVPIPDDLKRDE
jgi:flagellar biosynthetic protein FlhB